MRTVSILHGWSEGRWHTRQLVKELEGQGLEVIKQVEKADVIIAHSLGALMVPEKTTAGLILLIGVPYWPGRSVLKSMEMNLRHEASMKHSLIWWLRRSAWATFYVLKKMRTNYKTLKGRTKGDLRLPTLTSNRQVVMVRNQLDPFTHPKIQKLLPTTKKYKLVELPGGHEDWWINPQPYIDLLLKHI